MKRVVSTRLTRFARSLSKPPPVSAIRKQLSRRLSRRLSKRPGALSAAKNEGGLSAAKNKLGLSAAKKKWSSVVHHF